MTHKVTISCPDCKARSTIQWVGDRTPIIDDLIVAIVEEIYCSSHLRVEHSEDPRSFCVV